LFTLMIYSEFKKTYHFFAFEKIPSSRTDSHGMATFISQRRCPSMLHTGKRIYSLKSLIFFLCKHLHRTLTSTKKKFHLLSWQRKCKLFAKAA
jgi:hypothetical protein